MALPVVKCVSVNMVYFGYIFLPFFFFCFHKIGYCGDLCAPGQDTAEQKNRSVFRGDISLLGPQTWVKKAKVYEN